MCVVVCELNMHEFRGNKRQRKNQRLKSLNEAIHVCPTCFTEKSWSSHYTLPME